MQAQPRLIIPALGGPYRASAPITEPPIRVVAGDSLVIHGYPILFGDKAAAARFLESVGFQDSLFWSYFVFHFLVRGGGPLSLDALIGWEL